MTLRMKYRENNDTRLILNKKDFLREASHKCTSYVAMNKGVVLRSPYDCTEHSIHTA